MNDDSNARLPAVSVDDETIYQRGTLFFYIFTQRTDEILSSELGTKLNADERRTLCTMINAQLARLLDGGWIDADGAILEPLLTFIKRDADPRKEVGNLSQVAVPEQETMYQEGADDCAIFSYFDKEEDMIDPDDFEWGVRGEVHR